MSEPKESFGAAGRSNPLARFNRLFAYPARRVGWRAVAMIVATTTGGVP